VIDSTLQRLIADIEAGQIDVVVVYKVDRLTRALSDFAKLVEVFDRLGVSFVSITQLTTTSTGPTLNVLCPSPSSSEVTASACATNRGTKKKGMWKAKSAARYDVKDRKLVVIKAEARTVVRISALFELVGMTAKTSSTVPEQTALSLMREFGCENWPVAHLRNAAIASIGRTTHKGIISRRTP
jgi:hypothetical protein